MEVAHEDVDTHSVGSSGESFNHLSEWCKPLKIRIEGIRR
jgi:hypothetical protein